MSRSNKIDFMGQLGEKIIDTVYIETDNPISSSFVKEIHNYDYLFNSKDLVSPVTKLIMNNVNNVMGNVTYKTDKGTLSGLIYYDTKVDDLYLYGKIIDVKVDNESGYYSGRRNIINIEGRDDGVREVTIISKPNIFGL